ncbi:MAG: hypothetical protein WC829_11220 [Hyphomicrobium sp.]|jgi:hypothetical protein
MQYRLIAALIVFAATILPALAQSFQPQPGTPLRREILDAVRPVFEAETNGPVEFVVRRLNVLGDWAFGDVTLQRPGGHSIDWNATKYAADFAEGSFDPGGSFFLMSRSAKRWNVIEFSTGPTDVIWDGWRTDYKLPSTLFQR